MTDPVRSVPDGVGIDVEELAALNRFDRPAIARATARWLSWPEREWCARQPSAGQALLTVLCCREAAFKCGATTLPVQELRLRLEGGAGVGHARPAAPRFAGVDVVWRVADGRIVALAAAGLRGVCAEILGRLLETILIPGTSCPRSS